MINLRRVRILIGGRDMTDHVVAVAWNPSPSPASRLDPGQTEPMPGQAHLPGTEPSSRDLERARHNQQREHIRHRLHNLATRLDAKLTFGLTDRECHEYEVILATLEMLVDDLDQVTRQ